jgi:hypothetical protein
MGILTQFVRYKYSFYEYLYHFIREAQQTARKSLSAAFPRLDRCKIPCVYSETAGRGGHKNLTLLLIFPKRSNKLKILYGSSDKPG